MKKIVFVGQTPPPYGGQAIMIEKILAGRYADIELFHVRMSFSKEMDQIGKASLVKILHLIYIISKIYYYRIFKKANILYYPPAGPDRIPVIRDIIILTSTRWLFKKCLFHFHAGGVSQIKLRSSFLKWLYKIAYYHADWAIQLSPLNPPDGKNLKAKNEIIIPYGIEDYASNFSGTKLPSRIVSILFVSIIKESKGAMILLEAVKQLFSKGLEFKLEIMGKFESSEFEQKVKDYIKKHKLDNHITFLGVLSGGSKFSAFQRADIFCFPTFFESETFGVVLLEAMQFSLPVVATTWRGIPSIVKNKVNGFLIDPKNADELAKRLELLILDPSLRLRMGNEGRKIFLSKFTLKEFHDKMRIFFRTC